MFKTLKNNESGMALIMVILAIVIMMVFSIGVISRGVSQTKSTESQISRIRAEQMAIGAYARAYADLTESASMTSVLNVTLDNKIYTTTVTNNGPGGPNNTNTITISTPFN